MRGRGFRFVFQLIITSIFFVYTKTLFAADWDFTVEDYAKLRSSGGTLQTSSSSQWLPQSVRENVLATLHYVLDPKRNKRNTWGVTPRDFFHGHIVCKKPNTLPEQEGFVPASRMHANLNLQIRQAASSYADPNWNWDVSALVFSNPNVISVFYEIRRLTTLSWGAYLKKYLKFCENPAMVYHTFEFARPAHIDDDNPERHLEARFNKKGEFRIKEIQEAQYWNTPRAVHDEYFQIQFLIDTEGVVYLHPSYDYFFFTMPNFSIEDFRRTSAHRTELEEDRLD